MGLPWILLGLLFVQEPAVTSSEGLVEISVGETTSGELEVKGIRRFRLKASESGPITLSLESWDFDALLRIETESGQLIAEDDDSGIETNARVELELAVGETRLVIVRSREPETSGEFSLQVFSGRAPALSPIARSDAGIAFRRRASERALSRGSRGRAAGHKLEEGSLLFRRSRFQDARDVLEEALRLAEQAADQWTTASALGNLGLVLGNLGDSRGALDALERSRALKHELGDRDGEARTLGNLANLYFELDEYDRARELGEQRLRIAEQLGDVRGQASVLAVLANIHHVRRELDSALELHRRALAIWESSPDRHGEAVARVGLGQVLQAMKRWPEARASLEKSLELLKATGDRAAACRVQYMLGTLAQDEGRRDLAVQDFEAARALAAEIGDLAIQGSALMLLGSTLRSLGEYPRAREHLEAALALARRSGSRSREAMALANLGHLELDQGNPARAEELYQQLLSAARLSRDPDLEQAALHGLGNARLSQSHFDEAAEALENALSKARTEGREDDIAGLVDSLGSVYLRRGDVSRALACFEEALSRGRSSGKNPAQLAHALNNLGLVRNRLGELDAARQLFEESLALKRTLKDAAGAAGTLVNLGATQFGRGDYASAQKYFDQGLRESLAAGKPNFASSALSSLGSVALLLGEPGRALPYLEESLRLRREIGDRDGQAAILCSLALAELELDRATAARAYLDEAEAASSSTANDHLITSMHATLAQSAGDRAEAIRSLRRALELSRAQRRPYFEASNLLSIARLLLQEGDASEALALSREAAQIARDHAMNELEAEALTTWARASMNRRDVDGASAAIERAERLLEPLSSRSSELIDVTLLRAKHAPLAEIAHDLAWLRWTDSESDSPARSDAFAKGFRAASRWKGRSLLEGIAEHRSGARSHEAVELRQVRREALASQATLLSRVSEAIRGQRAADEIDELRRRAADQQRRADEAAERLARVSPRDAALDAPRGADPEEARKLLGPGELLIDFVEGERQLYAYVLGRETLTLIDLGAVDDVSFDLQGFLAGIQNGASLASPPDVARRGRQLYDRLLAPALAAARASSKESITRLCLVPSATLATLPFEALVVEAPAEPKRFDSIVFVLDRFETTYGPSVPVLLELSDTRPIQRPRRALILADPVYGGEDVQDSKGLAELLATARTRARPATGDLPRLPGTRAEALAVARLLMDSDAALEPVRPDVRSVTIERESVSLHLGSSASRARLRSDLRGFSILHIAGHGIIDPEHPQQSGLALSTDGDDGWFTIGDALELDLDCDLVVLSACQTARGQAKAGEGIESLARAFLYSGARAVVASLWQVSDWASAETMRSFYRARLEGGSSLARALHDAKVAIRRGRVRPGAERGISRLGVARTSHMGHPYFWAPFIHIGIGSRDAATATEAGR